MEGVRPLLGTWNREMNKKHSPYPKQEGDIRKGSVKETTRRSAGKKGQEVPQGVSSTVGFLESGIPGFTFQHSHLLVVSMGLIITSPCKMGIIITPPSQRGMQPRVWPIEKMRERC